MQEDVLRVVVAPPEEAARAWARLRPRLDVDDLWDDEIYRLLPQVAMRLRAAGIDDPDRSRMAGLHRRTWYLNQRRLHEVGPWLRRLHDEGIPLLALKGVPLALVHHADPGLRPMNDVDVLVPAADADRALDLLEAAGFVDSGAKRRDTLFRLHHGSGLVGPDGTALDLHWNLGAPFLLRGDTAPTASGPPGTASMADLWAASVPLPTTVEALAGLELRMLCPADLVLHLLVHGVWAGSSSTVRWIADLAAVLDDPRNDHPVDWGRLVAQARDRHLHVPVGSALRYAATTFSLAIPDDVLGALDPFAAPVPERRHFERMALDLGAADPRLGGLAHLRSYFAYTASPLGRVDRARLAPAFLADLWDAPSVGAVPAGLVRRVRDRLLGRGRPVDRAVPSHVREGRPAPAPPESISVVVPTHRRPDHLDRCLDALAAQRRRPDQVVVVHRPDDGASAAALARRGDELVAGVPLTIVPASGTGLIRAMHAGAGAATGAIVAFTDDDARPSPIWVEAILRHLAADGVGAVGGRDIVPALGDPVPNPVGDVGRIRWYGRFVGNHTEGTGGPRPVEHLKGVNMAYRADLLRFPAGLRGDGAEVYNEIALGLTVRAAGSTVVYDPELLVHHDLGPRFDADARDGATAAARADAVFNQSLTLFAFRPGWRATARLAYVVLWGDRGVGGLACCAGLALRRDPDLRGLWRRYLRANLDAWASARRGGIRMVAAGQPFPTRDAVG